MGVDKMKMMTYNNESITNVTNSKAQFVVFKPAFGKIVIKRKFAMITRRRRRRYILLSVALAFLTAFGSMWFSLEPAASEESRAVDLWEDSLQDEENASVDGTMIRILEAKSEANFSACDGKMAEGMVPESLSLEQLQAAMMQLNEAKSSLVFVDKSRTDNPESLSAEESEEEEEEEETYDWYEEEDSYSEPVYEEEEEVVVTEPEPETEEETSESVQEESQESVSVPSVSYSDLDYLAAICQIEAGSNYEGCLAVANVVLNRLYAGYASSIYGVIYAPYQFATGNMDYYLQNGTSANARAAAQDALNGSNNVGSYKHFNGTYWLDPESLDCPYVVIGGNVFY